MSVATKTTWNDIHISRPTQMRNYLSALRTRGMVVYDGESCIDGSHIVSIATMRTKNRKTGPMVQLWILQADIDPVIALNSGADRGVCGDCPLRGRLEPVERSAGNHLGASPGLSTANKDNGCYVEAAQAPWQIYYAWRAGRYVDVSAEFYGSGASVETALFNRRIRFGAYGEPTALPLAIVARMADAADGHTGYTHRWRAENGGCGANWSHFLHASTHTARDTAIAQARGWSVFQSGGEPGDLQTCPSARGVSCHDCLACRGNAGPSRFIPAHGAPATLSSFNRRAFGRVGG